ncbi:MAG: hypothetical protein WA419_18875 [Silvibacterium sp.]
MPSFCRVAGAILCGVASLAPVFVSGQEATGRALVQSIVNSELRADANDHSRWMFRDAKKVQGKSTITLVVQTSQGDISKLVEVNGRPPTPQEQREDEQKMHQFIIDPAVRQKQRRDHQKDDEKATALTRMLPAGFLWTKTGQSGAETTLTFQPDPKFKPPTREARVFAAMEDTMVVNTEQMRIESLKGKLTQAVDCGHGLLGKLEKGGTFDVERQRIGPKIWESTTTRVHIHGHALIFKSISEDQDEETSDYKPSPHSISPEQAENLLKNGTIARELGLNDAH